MYVTKYFPARYFPDRYFPKVGQDAAIPPVLEVGIANQGGIITFTSSAIPRPIIAPPLLDQDGGYWRPSISNDGIVSLTDNATVSEGELFAAIEDPDGVLWLWQLDPCDQAEVTTQVITSATPHRVSVKVTFTTDSDTSLPFCIYSIRPYLKIQKQDVPYRYEAAVECRVTRPSLRITWTGGPFVMDTIQPRLKALKNQVKG